MVPTAVLRATIAVSTQKQPRKDHSNATNVPLAVPPNSAVPNVPIANRANLKMLSTTKKFVPSAPLALHKVKRTKKFVQNVFKEKKHPKTAAVFARLATWANTTR
jgi:hypothetical protein